MYLKRLREQILAFVEELAQHGLVTYDAEQFQDGQGTRSPCTTGIAENLPDGGQEAGQLGSGTLRYERPRLELLTLETRAQGLQGRCPSGSMLVLREPPIVIPGLRLGVMFNYSCWGSV